MWFAEQLNSFLNLGECKEYPIMARSKSIPGSGVSRRTTSKDQTVTDNVGNLPDVQASAGTNASTEATQPVKVAPEVTSRPEVRKLEFVKNESRKNLVPINLEDEIRKRAFELYQLRGAGSGSEAEDWLTAEREVRQRYRQQSA
jgi:hypothetical protein